MRRTKEATTRAAETPPNGAVEEWNPRTAHEILVGMFHGLRNALIPAKHHLSKVPDKEAKAALKGVEQALALVGECVGNLTKVPGPTRANLHEDGIFVIIESNTNRVDATGGAAFDQVTLWHREDPTKPWRELTAWDEEEWRTPGLEAFEAIIGVITKIAAGEEIAALP